ncbi:hypothetical protein F5Y02DRAFT_424023 [Annulohypoxylon stygium]|nr:hypothetical protein F5Y02DRAFT_424023 [Annulohypoxylon stygium]
MPPKQTTGQYSVPPKTGVQTRGQAAQARSSKDAEEEEEEAEEEITARPEPQSEKEEKGAEEGKKDNTDEANEPEHEQPEPSGEPSNSEEMEVPQVKGFKPIPPSKYDGKEDPDAFLIQARTYLRFYEESIKIEANKSAADYAIEFKKLATESQLPAEGLFYIFYNGLKDHVKDELYNEDLYKKRDPKKLDAFIEKAITIDNENFERYFEKKRQI